MTKPTDQPVVAERRAGDRLKQSRYVDTIITKPTQPVVLVDREEAAKVADRDAKEWKAVSTNYLASDPMKTKAVARACMAEEIAIAIRHLPPYTTAPQFVEFHACDYDYSDDGKCIICGLPDNAPTTEARERALDAAEAVKPWLDPYSMLDRDWQEKVAGAILPYFTPVAAALSSTPSVGDAIETVKRLRDENRSNYEYWKSIASNPDTDFGVLKFAAWAGEDERVITALEALQPSTPSEQKEND